MDHQSTATRQADSNITQEMILAAENLFLAIAFEALVRERVNAYKAEILRTHGFLKADKYSQGLGLSERMILDPSFDWLMSDEDFQEYQRHCDLARRQTGLAVEKAGNCPSREAHTRLIDAQQEMVALMFPRTSLDWGQLTSYPGLLDEYLHETQRLMAPYVSKEAILARLLVGGTSALCKAPS